KSARIFLPPNPQYMFAALGDDQVAAINVTTNELAARINVGDGSGAVGTRSVAWNPDGARAYVALRYGGAISVIDTLTLRQVEQIALPAGAAPFWVKVNPQ